MVTLNVPITRQVWVIFAKHLVGSIKNAAVQFPLNLPYFTLKQAKTPVDRDECKCAM